MLRFREAVWGAYKIHPFVNPEAHLELCAAVKHAAGDSMVLMLDSVKRREQNFMTRPYVVR